MTHKFDTSGEGGGSLSVPVEREFRIEGDRLVVREGQETVRLPAGTNPCQRLSHVVKGHLGPGDEAIAAVLDAFEVEHVKLPKKKGDAT